MKIKKFMEFWQSYAFGNSIVTDGIYFSYVGTFNFYPPVCGQGTVDTWILSSKS